MSEAPGAGASRGEVIAVQREACYIPGSANGPYTKIADDTTAHPYAEFTSTQKERVRLANTGMAGLVDLFGGRPASVTIPPMGYSDLSREPLVLPSQVYDRQIEVDHIYPKEKGGGNVIANAQLLAKVENNQKSQSYPWASQPGYHGTRIFVTQGVTLNTGEAVPKGTIIGVTGAGSNATVTLPSGTTGSIGAARSAGLAPLRHDPL